MFAQQHDSHQIYQKLGPSSLEQGCFSSKMEQLDNKPYFPFKGPGLLKKWRIEMGEWMKNSYRMKELSLENSYSMLF